MRLSVLDQSPAAQDKTQDQLCDGSCDTCDNDCPQNQNGRP